MVTRADPGERTPRWCTINVDEPVLLGDDDGAARLVGGDALAPETARRLACDASLVWVIRGHATVSRSTSVTKHSSIPTSLCGGSSACATRVVAGSSAVPSIATPTSITPPPRTRWHPFELANLATLCWFHHRLVHEGGWCLERDTCTGAIRCHHAEWRPLVRRPSRPPLERARRRASWPTTANGGLEIDATHHRFRNGTASGLDLGFAVTSLWYTNHPEPRADRPLREPIALP